MTLSTIASGRPNAPSFSTKVIAFTLYALACAVVAGGAFGVCAGVAIATARAIVRGLS